nr:hypothetical protein CFP56_71110 [Quercus suber]
MARWHEWHDGPGWPDQDLVLGRSSGSSETRGAEQRSIFHESAPDWEGHHRQRVRQIAIERQRVPLLMDYRATVLPYRYARIIMISLGGATAKNAPADEPMAHGP